ncbi:patatin-like phospholipase family protein [Legionella israelensis]|uniref:patatin-like phospholipase family protein n=1 Tax=Legionella israelensis TaxID=454 RepID=UPI00142F5E90|nr:patatin-like phospholipase family protein [Legionella israelensis]
MSSCAKFIARQIQQAENQADKVYPPVKTLYPELKKSVDVKLERYKSVQTRPHQRNDMAVAIAISGGGYRAANLALGVLLGLEKIKSQGLKGNLLQEVDYFSTVSAGGLAVGFYLTKLHNYLQSKRNPPFSLQKAVNSMFWLEKEKANPLRADLMDYLYTSNKQGLTIERILNDTLLYTPEGGLAEKDIFISQKSARAVQLPYWVTNSTIYQNAAIFPFTPDVLATYRVRGFYHKQQDYIFRGSLTNPDYAFSMPVSVGLMASMSVPFAVPSTTLISEACGKECYLQLYDGGIADNLGVFTALNLLSQDKARIKLLMVIDSGKDLLQPFSQKREAPEGMSLVVRSATMTIDSTRKYLKSNLNLIAYRTLCMRDASHVVVIYFNLENYPRTQSISSKLTMTLAEQKLLIEVGKELVKKEKTLKQFLAELKKNELMIGACQPIPEKNESPNKESLPLNKKLNEKIKKKGLKVV